MAAKKEAPTIEIGSIHVQNQKSVSAEVANALAEIARASAEHAKALRAAAEVLTDVTPQMQHGVHISNVS